MRERKKEAADVGKMVARVAEHKQAASEMKKQVEALELTNIHLETENSALGSEVEKLKKFAEKVTGDMESQKIQAAAAERERADLMDNAQMQAVRDENSALEERVASLTAQLEEKKRECVVLAE